jgi:hypothetical protein
MSAAIHSHTHHFLSKTHRILATKAAKSLPCLQRTTLCAANIRAPL